MDDLDHSMHIAEYDWMSFYEESEECGLLQPSLACPDNLSLSDSEDSRKSSSIFDIGRQELQQSPAANSDEAESSAAGWCMEDMQINHGVSEGEQDNLMTKAEEDRERMVKSDKCIDYPVENTVYTEGMHMRTAEHNTVVTHDDITTTLQTVQLNVLSLDRQSTELTKQYGDMQRESDPSFLHEHGHVSGNQTELNVNEPHTRDAAVSDSVGSGTLTAEKERWFVTVDASSVKNKKRPKKTCKNNHTCQTLGQEKSYENGLKSEINNEPEGGRDSQSNQHSGCSSAEHPGSFQIGIFSDSSQISLTPDEGNSLSDELVTSHVIEPMIDRNKHVPRSLASTSQDTLKAKDPSRLDSVESDELGDSVEFLSIHSCDSESYLSASESVEDTQHLLMENQQLQSSSSVAKNSSLSSPTENTDADDTQDRQRFSSHNTLSCNVTATNCEICNVKPTLTFPSAAQSVNKMPDDNSCDNDRHCLQLCVASDTPGLQNHEINLSPSGCSPGDEMSLPFVSDETPTLRSVVSSPETYAVAAGQTRPVYAISAFWDEMEKLTINDILQLRICRETLPSDTQETVTQHVEDFPTNCSPLVDTVEYNLSDAALMDTSDTADSDYCTQLDESKPDRSSCEFSTSDFEEEYWHFLVASRNSSPDPHSKNQHRTIDCPFFVHEEEESTASEGRETPVPSKECFEDQDSDALISLAWPRRITKSESVWNVQALNTEDLSLLGNDESSLFLNSCPSLEENVLLKRSDSLGTLIPAHFLSNTTRCVTVYNPDNIFVAPVFDYTLCTFRDETSFSFLHDSQCIEKPIPIFSCCHPTVREFTFSNQDYVLSTDYEERDDFSQIKVGSRSFIQGSDCGMSAAALRGSCTLKSLLSRRKISFHDKGSIWSRGSGAWVFPVEAERNTSTRAEPSISVVTEGKGSSTTSQLCRELAVQQRILETIKTTRQEGIFSTLKQSDLCLVCIAFASWVLRSSDPEAADAWKAVLLANVSALSAIQYLRQYVKKNPSQEDP